MAEAEKGQRLLRLMGNAKAITIHVFQGPDGFEIEASQDGEVIHLKGERLEPLAKDLARKVGYKS